MSDHKAGNKSGEIHYVQTYAQRREQRLQQEKQTDQPTPTSLPDIPLPTSRTIEDISYANTRASTAADLKLPPINGGGTLSATDRDNYFGDGARNTFFDYYRQLARQRYTIGGAAGADRATEEEDLEALRNAKYGMHHFIYSLYCHC
jgi:hypothetical protein